MGPRQRAPAGLSGRLTALGALSLCAIAQAAPPRPVDAIVVRVVRARYGELHACYRRVLATDRHVGGTLFLRLTLGSGETLAALRVARDEVKRPDFADCVAQRVRTWRFAGLGAAGAAAGDELLVPLTFRADPKQYAVQQADVVPQRRGPLQTQLLLGARNVGARQAGLELVTLRARSQSMLEMPVRQQLILLEGQGELRTKNARIGLRPLTIVEATGCHELRAKTLLRLLRLTAPASKLTGTPPTSCTASGGARLLRPGRSVLLQGGRLKVTPLHVGSIYVGQLEARAGLEVPEHAHLSEAELIYVISGTGTMHVDGVPQPVSAGQGIYIPSGAAHGLRVTSALKVVQIYAPAGPQQRFFQAGAKGQAP